MNRAIAIVAGMFIASALLIVAGLYLLAGPAWAMIALGCLLCGAAVHLRAGLSMHG